jgi:hypothetical protein
MTTLAAETHPLKEPASGVCQDAAGLFPPLLSQLPGILVDDCRHGNAYLVPALISGVRKCRTDGAEAPGGAVAGNQTILIQSCRDGINTQFLVNVEVVDAPGYLSNLRSYISKWIIDYVYSLLGL